MIPRLFLPLIAGCGVLLTATSAAPNYPVARDVRNADGAWTRESGFVTDHAYVVGERAPVHRTEIPSWAEITEGYFQVPGALFVVTGPPPNPDWAPASFLEVTGLEASCYILRWPAYEALPPAQSLINVSTRATLAPGGSIIVGFVVQDHPVRFLLRAVGPSLVAHGVPNPTPNPQLTLFRGAERVVGNDDWGRGTDNAESLRWLRRTMRETGWDPAADPYDIWDVAALNPTAGGTAAIRHAENGCGAFPLAEDSLDAALMVVLAPGAYTMTVASDDAGEVLVEAYQISE